MIELIEQQLEALENAETAPPEVVNPMMQKLDECLKSALALP